MIPGLLVAALHPIETGFWTGDGEPGQAIALLNAEEEELVLLRIRLGYSNVMVYHYLAC